MAVYVYTYVRIWMGEYIWVCTYTYVHMGVYVFIYKTYLSTNQTRIYSTATTIEIIINIYHN